MHTYTNINILLYLYISSVPVWTFTESILAPRPPTRVVLSPCWWHETLYQTQSETFLRYWLILALCPHHFGCFYSCVTTCFDSLSPVAWPSPPRAYGILFGRNAMERMSGEEGSAFSSDFCDLRVRSRLLSATIGFLIHLMSFFRSGVLLHWTEFLIFLFDSIIFLKVTQDSCKVEQLFCRIFIIIIIINAKYSLKRKRIQTGCMKQANSLVARSSVMEAGDRRHSCTALAFHGLGKRRPI